MKKIYENFEYYSILLSAAGIITFVFISIVLRYVFNIVLSWPDELSRYLQLYIVWIGASAAFTRKKVLKIDFLQMIFKKEKVINIIGNIFTLIGSVILLIGILKFTYNKFQIMETSMIIGIPIWIVGFAISLSVLSLIIKVVISIFESLIQREIAAGSL